MLGKQVSIPISGTGENEMATDTAENEMATDTADVVDAIGDIDQDCAELALESMVETHEGLMAGISANNEMAGNIVRLSGARKFNREDPLEAAAAETILKRT